MIDVSVIIPCYNAEKTILRALSSVIDQKAVTEIIIIDDCSTDTTRGILESFALIHENVRLIYNYENKGPGYSRNRGLDCFKGRYVAFLDADDIWLPGKISEQLNFMDNNSLDFSFHDYYQIEIAENKILKGQLIAAPDMAELPSFFYTRGYGMCLTSLISANAVDSIRFPEARSIYTEDYLFFLYLLSKYKGVRLAKPLGVYLSHKGSRSSNKLRQAYSVLRCNCLAIKTFSLLPFYYFIKYLIHQIFSNKKKQIIGNETQILIRNFLGLE